MTISRNQLAYDAYERAIRAGKGHLAAMDEAIEATATPAAVPATVAAEFAKLRAVVDIDREAFRAPETRSAKMNAILDAVVGLDAAINAYQVVSTLSPDEVRGLVEATWKQDEEPAQVAAGEEGGDAK